MMKRISLCVALLMTLVLACHAVPGFAENDFRDQIEENTEENRVFYPYKVVTGSAVLYLAQEDIELLGEEAYFAGLNRILEYLEDDFAEAREILKDWLKDDIPPVRISTCFANQSGRAQAYAAYYYNPNVGIRLFGGWTQTGTSLLHEYVHYLTLDNFRYSVKGGFWVEGIAQYISMLACTNRMNRAFNNGVSDEDIPFLMAYGLTDEDGKVDIRKYTYWDAALWDLPLFHGIKYTPVSGRTMTMTQRTQEHPTMNMLTYSQAACFIEFLVQRFGEDQVFTHMACDNSTFRGVYGRTFESLCLEWKQENLARCAELGLNLEIE